MEYFEFVDRVNHPRIIQEDAFEKLSEPPNIKVGDKFICPKTVLYPAGYCEDMTHKPILLTCTAIKPHHLQFKEFDLVEREKNLPSLGIDLCYKLIIEE